MVLRKASDRGQFENNWLKARYIFSFANYHDSEWMGWGKIRVLNHDQVQPLGGFPPHSHRYMEIITYVINGAVEHEDSMGHKKLVRAGEVQVMSAGTGVEHSEYNPLKDQVLELFQIWVFPKESRIPPRYDQMAFPKQQREGQLKLMVAPPSENKEVMSIHQGFYLYGGHLKSGQVVEHVNHLPMLWIQVARGAIEVAGQRLEAGDGLGLEQNLDFKFQSPLKIQSLSVHDDSSSEFVLMECEAL